MVYYFNNKEGIFRAVLDAFFYGPDNLAKIKQEQNKSLKLFYNLFIEKIKGNISLLLPYNIPNLSEARLNIERSAAQFIPGFKQKMATTQKEDGEIWEGVVRNSVESGELRGDIDIKATAELFQAITLGFFYMCSKDHPEGGVDYLRHLYDAQYALIKN